MKVAQVCPRFYPHIGGVETHVHEISKRLAKYFDIEIVTTDPTGKLNKIEEIDNLTVRRFKSFAPSDAYFFSSELYRYLKRNSSNYNIIHAHNYHALPALFAALSKDKNKFVFTPHYHGKGHSFLRNLLHKPYKLIGKTIFKKSDAVICVSKFEQNLVLKNFRLDKSKLFVIPNGVNLHEFKNIGNINKQKNKNLKVILYVGRIEKYKGIDYLVKVLKYLPEYYILEIVGKGRYKSKIIKLAKKLKVISRIKFYQDLSRQKLIEKYAKADVLVLLSKYEAYGLVVAEALACKTPCIVANTSALYEWVDGKNVFGINTPINVKNLANLITKAVNTKVENVSIPDWNYTCRMIKNIYFNLES